MALKEFRKERGFTQERLAFDSGYHPTYIGQLERGVKSPTLRSILSITTAMNIRAAELIERVENLWRPEL